MYCIIGTHRVKLDTSEGKSCATCHIDLQHAPTLLPQDSSSGTDRDHQGVLVFDDTYLRYIGLSASAWGSPLLESKVVETEKILNGLIRVLRNGLQPIT